MKNAKASFRNKITLSLAAYSLSDRIRLHCLRCGLDARQTTVLCVHANHQLLQQWPGREFAAEATTLGATQVRPIKTVSTLSGPPLLLTPNLNRLHPLFESLNFLPLVFYPKVSFNYIMRINERGR